MCRAPGRDLVKRQPNIKDVAAVAGVSVGTVSHFLSGRQISESRSAKIKQAISDLGYTRNPLAQGMRRQTSMVIGMSTPFINYPSFAALTDWLEDSISKSEFDLMQVLSRNDPERELLRIRRLIAYKVRGIFLVPSMAPEETLNLLSQAGIPTILMYRYMPEEIRFDQIGINHQEQCREIGAELIERGYRSIFFGVTFPYLRVTKQRVRGFEEAIAQSGKDVRLEVLSSEPNHDAFVTTLTARLRAETAPTYVVTSNSDIAARAISALHEAHSDGGILTMDEPNWLDIVERQVSFIRQPLKDITQRAWQCLENRWKNPDLPPNREWFPGKIVWRGDNA